MKCRVVYFSLCLCFCFSLLSLSSSAVGENLDEGYIYNPGTGEYYIPDIEFDDSAEFTVQASLTSEDYEGDPDMLDQGWLYDSSSDTYYMSDLPPTPGFLVSTEPNYSGFNISKIPFHEAPKYITDIVYMGMEDAVAAGDYSTYKVPFVMVQVISSTRCRVIAGINLNVSSWYNGSGNFTGVYITAFPAFGSYQYSICYEAYFDWDDDYSVNIPWRQLSPIPVGDTVKAVRFTGSLITSSTVTDLYFYGGNGNKIDPDVTLASVPVNSSNSREQFVSYVYKGIGFSNGNFIPNIDILNPNCYLAQFLPTTPEQAEAQTQKGIWNTLKSIPDMIGEKLKSLFVPSDGFFDTYINSEDPTNLGLQPFFKERFGIVYEIPDEVIGVLQQFVDFDPSESGYKIHFPEVVMPVLEGDEWQDVVIIEESDVTFDFLEQGAFKTMYNLYRSVLWLIFVFALIGLIIRKGNRIFGG